MAVYPDTVMYRVDQKCLIVIITLCIKLTDNLSTHNLHNLPCQTLYRVILESWHTLAVFGKVKLASRWHDVVVQGLR